MKKVEDLIQDAKQAIPDVTPVPPGLKPQSSPHDLKERLEWGEPALTILDVRDRATFNMGHIMGAMSMPLDQLVERAKPSLDFRRDIYVYGSNDAETAEAARQLREAGFTCVSELQGGLEAWKMIAGSTEGNQESRAEAGPEGYNVVSQLQNHKHTQESLR